MTAHHKKKKKKVNFLNNSDLLEETKKSQKDGKMTEKLGKMLILLCDKYRANRVRRANFTNYSYFEDMKSFALLNLVKSGWHKFDTLKYQNAFAFYTQCIHNSYLQYLNSEKRHRNVRDALLVENGHNPSFKYMEENSSKQTISGLSEDIIDDNRQDETINYLAENHQKK